MPSANLHAKPFDEATLVKLEIFEKYLEAWLSVFAVNSRHTEVTIIDFFAGSGKDPNGILGSPLRIFSSIKKLEPLLSKSKLKINVVLNELDGEKVASLKESLPEEKITGLAKIEVFNLPFRELFEIKRPDLQKTVNMLFIDQNGVKEVDDILFKELCLFPHTDFLFFISSSFVKRFNGEEEFRKYLGWMGVDPFKDVKQKDTHRAILNLYKNIAPGQMHLIPFSIKKGINIYGLIFGTKRILAAEKILEVLWKTNNINGEANYDIDEEADKIQRDFFQTKLTKIEEFFQIFRQFILEKERTNLELYEYTIKSGFLPKHANELLKQMKTTQEVDYKYSYIGHQAVYKEKKVAVFKLKGK